MPEIIFSGFFLKDFIMSVNFLENTYVTLDFADNYFSGRINSDAWFNSDDVKKEQALVSATIKINNFTFIGSKKSSAQKLEFPRNFIPELPLDIQYAVCEEAIALIENSNHAKNKNYGIASVSIGSFSVSYFEKNNSQPLLSALAFNLISKWTVKNFDIN